MKEAWIVHVIGPDEIFYFESELDALRRANELNTGFADFEKTEHSPTIIAVVRREEATREVIKELMND